MDLVTPEFGLGIWMVFVILAFAFFLYAMVHIFRAKDLTSKGKFLFFILVLVMPILGAMLYFNLRETEKIYK